MLRLALYPDALTDVQLAGATKEATQDALGVSLAASLLLVDLADLAAVVAALRSLGGDEGHGGDDGEDVGELHFD